MKKFNVVYHRQDAEGKLVVTAEIIRAETPEILEAIMDDPVYCAIRSIHPFPLPCVKDALENIKRGLTTATAT